jgi:hypothetical protein
MCVLLASGPGDKVGHRGDTWLVRREAAYRIAGAVSESNDEIHVGHSHDTPHCWSFTFLRGRQLLSHVLAKKVDERPQLDWNVTPARIEVITSRRPESRVKRSKSR